MVAMPPVIKHINSDLDIVGINGRTNNGASVCPRKIFPAAERLSAPDNLMVLDITQAIPKTTFCKTPK
jgi:hypothetical protein